MDGKKTTIIPYGSSITGTSLRYIEVIGWVADNINDPENTLSFILQDLEKKYPPFYWPAFCVPFKVRKQKIAKWLGTGKLPNHTDFADKNLLYYNLIINNKKSKVLSTFSNANHVHGFTYHILGDAANKTYRFEMSNIDNKELLTMLFDSYVGSVRRIDLFKVNITFYVHRGRVYTESNTSEELVGYTNAEEVLVVLPSKSFQHA